MTDKENSTSRNLFLLDFRSRRLEHTRHAVFDTALCQLFFEHGADARIFVLVFDLIAACLHALGSAPLLTKAGKLSAAERLERQIARRLAADVEVLMKPALRRYQQTPRTPIVALDRFALAPHDRKPFSSENDDVRAGAAAVRFLICSDRK